MPRGPQEEATLNGRRGEDDGVAEENGERVLANSLQSESAIDERLKWSSRQRKREVLAGVAVIALVLLWQEVIYGAG